MTETQEYRATVLVIDDEESMREGCRQTLEAGGYRALAAENGYRGLQLMGTAKPAVVLLDLKMPGMDGMHLLEKIQEMEPTVVSVVITGYGTVESAVEAMRLGAYDYIQKPLTPEQLAAVVNRSVMLAQSRKRSGRELPVENGRDAFVIKLILRKASRDASFGRKLLYEGLQELAGWELSAEARQAIMSRDITWLTKRCGGLSGEEREWLDGRPW